MIHELRLLRTALVGALVLLAAATLASAQTDIAGLSLEDLLNTEITSVSRKEQTLSRTAAAVHVITSDDIRRSGATTLPEVLRMAPGFTVSQVDATSWAVTARGFNGYVANKLLVLIDGRNIYSPMFAGVHWEMQNLPLSEIERIEMVRGPGGTLWGANAINGVINIITKRADQTQGVEVKAGAGTVQRRLTEARYGARAGERGYYRVFAGYSNRGTGLTVDGFSNPDDSSASIFGSRFDWRGDVNTVFVTGSVSDSTGHHLRAHPTLASPDEVKGINAGPMTEGSVLASWNHSSSSRSEYGIQAFYQSYSRSDADLVERWQISDVEARRRLAVGPHEVVFGGGVRSTYAHGDNGVYVRFTNPFERKNLYSAFAQDEIELHRDLRLTPGAKFEHNGRTGFEWQPSIRGVWTPTRGQSLWAAVSRAVRTPSKIDNDLFVPTALLPIPGPLPALLSIEGSRTYKTEDMEGVEWGYRLQRGIASVDVAAFAVGHDDLQGTKMGTPYVGSFEQRPVLIVPLQFVNAVDAEVRGVEVSSTVQPISSLRLTGSYNWLRVTMGKSEEAVEQAPTQGPVPQHQYQLRTYLDLPARTEVTAMLYAASAIDDLQIEPYTRLDLRLAWRVLPKVQLSATVQNLFRDRVVEYTDIAGPQSVPTRTAVFAGATWSF